MWIALTRREPALLTQLRPQAQHPVDGRLDARALELSGLQLLLERLAGARRVVVVGVEQEIRAGLDGLDADRHRAAEVVDRRGLESIGDRHAVEADTIAQLGGRDL